MTIYFITIFFLFLFSILEVSQRERKKNTALHVASYLLIVFVIGFRWETGTDWDPYLDAYTFSGSMRDLKYYFSEMEFGYILLNYLLHQITESYSVFLIVHACIFYALIIRSFIKLVAYPQVAIFLFFCINIGITGSNRQLLAVAICMASLTYFIVKANRNFFLSILAAMLFHTTAILFSLYYFLNRKIKDLYLYGAILLAVVLGQTSLPNVLFSLFGLFGGTAEDKTKLYMDVATGAGNAEEALSLLGLLKRLLFVIFFIMIRNKVSKKAGLYNLFLNGYIFGVTFYFIFATTFLIMVNRGSIYFNIMESLLLSLILVLFNRPIDRILYVFFLLLLGVALFYQSISAYPDLFDPYKGIFINSDYYRRMY